MWMSVTTLYSPSYNNTSFFVVFMTRNLIAYVYCICQ